MISKKYLTFKELEEMNASNEELKEFEKYFGKKASLFRLVKRIQKIKDRNWESWLLAQNPNLTRSLLKYGANVHVRVDKPLRLAASYSDIAVIKVLLKNGADANARNNEALRFAEKFGNFETAAILKKAIKRASDV